MKLIFKNPDFFNLLDMFYPFNYINIEENENIKSASQLIYTWINLYKYKNNFSVREHDNKYDIIFNEDQSNEMHIYSYFILNEKENTLLSKGSYLSIYDLEAKDFHKYYVKEISKEGTNKMLTIIIKTLSEINGTTINLSDNYLDPNDSITIDFKKMQFI